MVLNSPERQTIRKMRSVVLDDNTYKDGMSEIQYPGPPGWGLAMELNNLPIHIRKSSSVIIIIILTSPLLLPSQSFIFSS